MILVKFPSRQRPVRFKQVLQQWIAKVDDLSQITWLFSFDKDDHTMRGMAAEIAGMGIDAHCIYGRSANKIHAINRDINEFEKPWDILLVLSDDMWPTAQGWDRLIVDNAICNDNDRLFWYPDGRQQAICTLPCMGRTYYDRTGFVYHPSYASVFADDEQTDVARSLGNLIKFDRGIADHQHPANGFGKPDKLYERNETTAIWKRDEANYKRRKAQGFPA